MSRDLPDDLRQAVAAMSPEELRRLLDGILTASGDGDPYAHLRPPRPEPVDLPEPPEEELALTVRVDVDGTRPPVWRRLVLHGHLTLDEVHDILQAAFGWLDMHLHRFWPGPAKQIWTGPFFTTPGDEDFGDDEDAEGMQSEADVRLDQVLRKQGDRLFYTYDFGDSWTCTIKLESVAPLDPASEPAVCTAARMAGPLEDCGGVPGHQELVEGFRARGLAGLPEMYRDWVPPGWDPFEEDVASVTRRLALIGKSTAELMAEFAALPGEEAIPWPAALEPLIDLATPDVVHDLAELVRRARDTSQTGDLTDDDLAETARPYRYLVELAGTDGIPLTSAGWMKPVVVEQIYRDLGFDETWIGKGNREDLTAPVADLRERCQRVGLLRKHKGRLLRTKLAAGLSSDEDYVRAVTARLIHDKDELVQAAQALFALHSAGSGEADHDDDRRVAELMTRCGLRTGPSGVEPRAALEWGRDVYRALRQVSGLDLFEESTAQSRRRVAGVARRALWPQG